ncbi:MAG: ATP-dependent protease ATPase subunit HslU [Dethiobacter sp.]|jgi:ATP-dependent HslUV protease ATP-binding subunit HslU|nr:MAG: ATP-dependent protease ATPase subunit HslU [Dethiobacter sp.]
MFGLEAELTPKEIVKELDKYIIGQGEAKKCVAVALRNRYRRRKLKEKIKDEIVPKNIVMIGPTGVGKTEIARRLARLVNAPFIKVEATKFTEVGYVGRDVDSIVRDLIEISVRIVKTEKIKNVEVKASELAEERLLDLFTPLPKRQKAGTNPLSLLFQTSMASFSPEKDPEGTQENLTNVLEEREIILQKLKRGELEEEMVEVELEERSPQMMGVFSGLGLEEGGVNFQDIFSNFLPAKKKKKKLPLKQARKILQQEEGEKLIDMDEVINEAIDRAEQSGIVFLDEIDKIAGKETSPAGPDVSREGVQRDILPIVEGSTVMTKYGPVKTDYMLFIAAGAFHFTKPSDLIPELQGRFPIRVELQSLSNEDFKKILTEPENALIKQYSALLTTEGVTIEFTDDGIEQIADIACSLNDELENIGARRLHTIMEKLLEDISYEGPDLKGQKFVINSEYVKNKLKDIVKNKDLSRYIL